MDLGDSQELLLQYVGPSLLVLPNDGFDQRTKAGWFLRLGKKETSLRSLSASEIFPELRRASLHPSSDMLSFWFSDEAHPHLVVSGVPCPLVHPRLKHLVRDALRNTAALNHHGVSSPTPFHW